MISPDDDGRDNVGVEDWFFLENQKKKNVNSVESPSNGQDDGIDDRKRTKDFIESELHAMSTLSLYDDSADNKAPEADKWVIAHYA